jgi:hypothetical protein
LRYFLPQLGNAFFYGLLHMFEVSRP